MALNDVIFQDLFTSYVIPISGVLVIVALLKDSLRRFYLRIRSNISVHIDEVYERATCKHKEKLFAQLLQLSQSIDRPLKILELNIGYGDNFKYYPAGCDVVCLDPDPYYEDYIQNTASEDYPQIRFLDFVVGTGEILCGLPDSCLDVVIITHGLCHEADPSKTIKEIFRILKKGGRLYFIDHTVASRWSFVYFLQLLVQPVYWTLGMSCDFRRDAVKMLQNCPFKRTENEIFRLEMSRFSLVDRLLVPLWRRVHVASAATK